METEYAAECVTIDLTLGRIQISHLKEHSSTLLIQSTPRLDHLLLTVLLSKQGSTQVFNSFTRSYQAKCSPLFAWSSRRFSIVMRCQSLVAAYAALLSFIPPVVGDITVLDRDVNAPLKASYDYVVVGGGIAGLVVTNRLSEDADVDILCIEAGNLYV